MTMTTDHDVIVVGARCAGAPTALLLARRGHRVLLLDRDTFPSDTVSTHLVHPPGIAALARWGLLDDLVATGCPPIDRYRFDMGPVVLDGDLRPTPDGFSTAHGPRRHVLDQLLVEAAVASGVTFRDGVHVDELLFEDGRVVGVRAHDRISGTPVVERAGLVVGADGRQSKVASLVGAECYREQRARAVSYYAYWSDLPVDCFDVHLRPGRAVAGMPTHDALNCLVVAAPRAEMETFRDDIEGNYLRALRAVPEYGDRIGAATRESRFVGMAVPNFYRRSWGPGWALVGDASYERDPCTAQGITDAFLDAESLVAARQEIGDGADEADVMTRRQQERDERTLPMFELTCQLAALEPPPPEMAELLGALASDPLGPSRFVSMVAGTLSVPEFFQQGASPATRPPVGLRDALVGHGDGGVVGTGGV